MPCAQWRKSFESNADVKGKDFSRNGTEIKAAKAAGIGKRLAMHRVLV